MHNVDQSITDNLLTLPDAHSVLSHLGTTIQERRQKLGLSAEQVAARAGISKANMEALEHGEWDADMVSLISVAGSLKMKLSQLMNLFEKRLLSDSQGSCEPSLNIAP